MKKIPKGKRKNSHKIRNSGVVLFFGLVVAIVAILPTVPTNKFSFGATDYGIQFTPVPAKSSLQLETFELTPTPETQSVPQSGSQQQKPNIPHQQVPQQTFQPGQSFQHIQPKKTWGPTPVGFPTPVKSGKACVGFEDTTKHPPTTCSCPQVTVICKNGKSYLSNGQKYAANPCGDKQSKPTNGRYCLEKPVIYLYPTQPTSVDVAVISTGQVTVSDPLYPDGGWKHVLADPNGTLTYQDKQYSELFYETSVTTFAKPTSGIVIPTGQLNNKLNNILDQLGLVGREKEEFIDFWVPQLQTLNSPYIYFSLLDSKEKAKVDTVNIMPKPDTQIAFIAYFKPVATDTNNSVLKLPTKPERKGFVSVEWGGVLDK